MAEKSTKKTTKKVARKDSTKATDKLSVNKNDVIAVRGRSFEGIVIRKHHKRITIEFERMIKIPKYERYEKRKTKLHARLPDHMADSVDIGDRVRVSETRPISKTIHSIVTKVIKSNKNMGE